MLLFLKAQSNAKEGTCVYMSAHTQGEEVCNQLIQH